jgi:uncharacterized membrane protein
MLWGFGLGLWFLLPLLFLGRFFWIILLALLIGSLFRRLSYRRWQAPVYAYHYGAYGTPPMQSAQANALDILRQRYARGEIDAATFDQMRERLEGSSEPRQ